MSEQQVPGTGAGIPGGRSPSGAVSPGTTPADAEPATAHDEQGDTATPGQAPGTGQTPVPSPGDVPGAAVPAVQAAEAASPEDGIVQGEKSPGSDAAVASPGSFTALAVPGHPDGEVDTRAR